MIQNLTIFMLFPLYNCKLKSSIMGIAVITLPAGIMTAGYMQDLDEEKNKTAG